MRPVALACVLLGSTSAAAQGFVEWRVTSVFDEWRVTPVFERLRVTLGVSMQQGAFCARHGANPKPEPKPEPEPEPNPGQTLTLLWS